MITNFEKLTVELTEDELILLPVLVDGLKTKTKEKPMKAPDIVKGMNAYIEQNSLTKTKMTEVRLRKMTNYIRSNGMIPLIATSEGYYTSLDKTEIKLQIQSLEERARSILSAAEGLKKYL